MTDHETFFDELQRDVNADHSRIDGASVPPANMWKSIRSQVKPEMIEEEKTEMINSHAISQAPAPVTSPVVQRQGGVRHTLSLAASFLIVMSVALGGWFATMQINQPGGSNGQFALFSQTDDSATCDVEPMTVDEVMAIVENPYKYANPSDYGATSTDPAPWFDEFAVVQPMISETLSAVVGSVPTQSAMDQALPVLDQYIACIETGMVAQALRFVDPFSIQEHVTSSFVFYRNEPQVRKFVESWIAKDSQSFAWVSEESGELLTFSPNLNRDEARTQAIWLGLGFNQVLFIGSNVMDEEGNPLARHDANFQLVEGEKQPRFMRYTLVYSMYTDQWYVVTGEWPMKPRI